MIKNSPLNDVKTSKVNEPWTVKKEADSGVEFHIPGWVVKTGVGLGLAYLTLAVIGKGTNLYKFGFDMNQ